MRLWSLHPRMLDQKGLVACWREALLAKAVLECKTKGYKNHPQLNRFKNSENPLISINLYLKFVYIEAKNRGYKFDKTKFIEYPNCEMIRVTRGQVDFEYRHLLAKFESIVRKAVRNGSPVPSLAVLPIKTLERTSIKFQP